MGHLEVDSNKKNEECLLKKYLRLIQFCSCPKILFPHLQGPFPKDFYVFKEIENANKLKEPIIIWTAFNETSFYLQSILKKHYPNLKVFLVNGRTPLQKRNFEISNFKRSPFSVLIATIGTCKEGLNLQNASRAVFVDSSYKLDDFLQAQDRIHRLFQKKKCKVFQLLYNNSIEIWINRLLKAKEHLAKDVFNNESNIDHNVFNSLFDEKETLNEIKIISSFY
ncbi:hypothetical protein EBU91_04565 [bacterium]|nr:hypothetical protein [bacterium]